MCLDIRAGSKPKVLTEDLEVFKVGTANEYSFIPAYYRKFEYTINVKTDIIDLIPQGSKEEGREVIEEGYHAYIDMNFVSNLNLKLMMILGRDRGLKYVVGTFIYPAGTIVYRDDHNEIVGNQIIFTGKYRKL